MGLIPALLNWNLFTMMEKCVLKYYEPTPTHYMQDSLAVGLWENVTV